MNTKKISLRFICLTLVLCICLPLAACKKDDPPVDNNNSEDEKKIFTTNAKNNDFAGYGNYVFYEWGTVYRYNKKTETLDKACRDVECDGEKCPLEGDISSIGGVYDGKLYFFVYKPMTIQDKVFIGYQDILSGEITVLKTMDSDLISLGSEYIYVEGEYVYYEATTLKEGGDKTNSNDYERSICRISLDGKKDEVFIKCAENEGMAIVCDGKIIMSSDGELYSIDIETKEKRFLFDCEEYDTLNIVGNIRYVKGKIYFLAESKHRYVPEVIGGEIRYKILFSVDINTGEVKKVVEDPVVYFCVSDDAVYYVPFNFKILYMPEDYENNKDDLKVWWVDSTVYACDLDGKNIRAVYSNDKISYSRRMAVFGGVLYSLIGDYDEEEHYYSSKVSFGAIDLETGKIAKKERPK